MIKEIVDFVDANEGINSYLDARLDGIFLYYKLIDNNFIGPKIIKSKNDTFNSYEMENGEIVSVKLDFNIQKVLYYIKVYSKGVNNNFQAHNKVKSLDSTSPFFMKIHCDFDGKSIEFYKFDKNKENRQRLEISKNIEAHFFKAMEFIYEEDYKDYICNLQDIIIKLITDSQNNKILFKILEKELSNKKDKNKLEQENIYICLDVGKEQQYKFDDFYLENKSFTKRKEDMIFSKGRCAGCNIENQEMSAPFLFTNYDNTFAYKNIKANYNFQVCQKCANKLIKFLELTKLNISNPLPLILYRNNRELSAFSGVFKLLSEKGQPKNCKNVIKELYFKYPKSLKNYYLLNFKFEGPQKKLFVKDIDYVESFKYMTSFKLYNYIGHIGHTISVDKEIVDLSSFYDTQLSIFQFEKLFNDIIFDGELQNNYFKPIKKHNEGFMIFYKKYNKKKDTLENSSNKNTLLVNYLMKYRQNFYDYIYKSHQSAFDLIDFREMLLDIIIDNIKHDDKNKNGYSIYENEIKEKLNLLFSLNQHKETKLDSKEFINLKNMAKNSIGYWQNKKDENGNLSLKNNGKNKKEFIGGVEYIENNDRLYAFLCGQLSRFLIGKRKGEDKNKSHADFAGFTEWQTSKLLKEHIWEVHSKYAHALKFDKKYDNVMSMVMSYRDDLEIADVMEYMIVGYFSDNQIKYQDNKIQENENE